MTKNSWYIYLAVFLLFEGLFPIFSYFALQSMPTLCLFVAATTISIVFWLWIFFKEKLYTQYQKKEILFPTLISSVFMWVWGLLYFFWIKYSSPSIASMLLLLQTFFAFIIFNLLWKEPYHIKQLFGAMLMFLGGIIVLYEWDSFVNLGAIIMIVACIIFTIWNFFTKKAVKYGANPFFLLLNRNILMVIITTILALVFVWPFEIANIQENFLWIFLIGFLVLFLWKASWVMALTKLDSFVAISSFPVIPLLVMVFSFFILGEVPGYKEIFGFIPIVIGTILLVKK